MSTEQHDQLLEEIRALRNADQQRKINKWNMINNAISVIVLAIATYAINVVAEVHQKLQENNEKIKQVEQVMNRHQEDDDWKMGNIEYNFQLLNKEGERLAPIYKYNNNRGGSGRLNEIQKD